MILLLLLIMYIAIATVPSAIWICLATPFICMITIDLLERYARRKLREKRKREREQRRRNRP